MFTLLVRRRLKLFFFFFVRKYHTKARSIVQYIATPEGASPRQDFLDLFISALTRRWRERCRESSVPRFSPLLLGFERLPRRLPLENEIDKC